MSDPRCVVVGASHAAAQIAPSLRQSGWTGTITVLGEEQTVPYHRPPLSKLYLAGEKSLDEILIRPAASYEKIDIEFRLGCRVASLAPDERAVTLADGERVPFDALVLAVGSRVRRLPLPGSDLGGVHYLRDIADVDRIRSEVRVDGNAVIVGGGYIGLETAAALRKLGMRVTVLEMMDRVMQRVTAECVSDFYTRVHREEGVEIFTNARVAALEGTERVRAVACEDGTRHPADLVVIGAGIVPNTELAAEAGLDVQDGIVVNENCQTSNEQIYAIGDCAKHYDRRYGRWVRLESVQNATGQAKVAAATICGQERTYDELPWFWSDQYDLKLQIAGLSQGFDGVVIRGDSESGRSFAVFYFAGDRLLAVDAVNRPKEFVFGKKALTAGVIVDKERLGDEAFALSALAG